MRNVISLMHISLDGFCGSANGDFEWIIIEPDISEYVGTTFATVDTAIYGRYTYEGMKGYWPTVPNDPNASEWELNHAKWVENIKKVVFSTSLDNADWNNTTLYHGDVKNVITKLKQEPGGDMMIFGSPRLVHSMMEQDLIDEYRLQINPILIGNGIPMFKNIAAMEKLKLVSSRTFSSGVLAVHYLRDRKE